MNARRYERFAALRITVTWIGGCLVASALMSADSIAAPPVSLDAKAIGEASGATATATPDGVVKSGWTRTDVTVTGGGVTLPPATGDELWWRNANARPCRRGYGQQNRGPTGDR